MKKYWLIKEFKIKDSKYESSEFKDLVFNKKLAMKCEELKSVINKIENIWIEWKKRNKNLKTALNLLSMIIVKGSKKPRRTTYCIGKRKWIRLEKRAHH